MNVQEKVIEIEVESSNASEVRSPVGQPEKADKAFNLNMNVEGINDERQFRDEDWKCLLPGASRSNANCGQIKFAIVSVRTVSHRDQLASYALFDGEFTAKLAQLER